MKRNAARTRTRVIVGAAMASLVGVLAVVGCGSSSDTSTPQQIATTTAAAPNAAAPNAAAPNAASGDPASITEANICTFATVGDIETATGVSGLVATPSTKTNEDPPEFTCTYHRSGGTAEPVAFLGYPVLLNSTRAEADDHGLPGLQLEKPQQSDLAGYDAMAPAMKAAMGSRLATKVQWKFGGQWMVFRFGAPSTDADAAVIAEAASIQSKLPG